LSNANFRATFDVILLYGLALYLCLGIVTAVGFVIFDVTRVLHHPVSMTVRSPERSARRRLHH
jgi:hypothetical protein